MSTIVAMFSRFMLQAALMAGAASMMCAEPPEPATATAPDAPAPPAATQTSPAVAATQAGAMLMREAQLAMKHRRLPRQNADFAAGFPGTLDPVSLGSRITRSTHSDPFIDGYVRWQLTSFKPRLPEMSDEDFQKMLDRLPPVIDNPRAADDYVTQLQAGSKANPLSKTDQTQARLIIDDVATRAAMVESFNRAPLGFRAWLRSHSEPGSMRDALMQIEECRQLVVAGWNVDSQKKQLETLFEAMSKDQSLSEDSRHVIINAIGTLAGKRRLLISSASLEGDTLRVEYFETAIDDFEVRRWVRLLKGD